MKRPYTVFGVECEYDSWVSWVEAEDPLDAAKQKVFSRIREPRFEGDEEDLAVV